MNSHRLLLALLLLPLATYGADSRVSKCEAVWETLYSTSIADGHTQDNGALLKTWQAQESTCKGTGVYEYRLAVLQIALGNPTSARELLAGANAWPPPYAEHAAFLTLQIQLAEYAAQKPLPLDKIRAMKPQYLAVAAKATDSPSANQQVANYLVLIGDYPAAVPYAEKSLKLEANQWEPNRSLAIAYSHTGKYAEAVVAGRRAQSMRNSLVQDPEFMYAVSKGFAGVGNITVAEKTLAILYHEVPSANGTADWRDAIAFIQSQVNAGNRKN